MSKFKAGQRVRVVSSDRLLAWPQGKQTIGHEFVLSEYGAKELNEGHDTSEPQQKYPVNYPSESLLIVSSHSDSRPETDLEKAERLVNELEQKALYSGQTKYPTHGKSSQMSDIDRCDQLARTAEQALDVKALRNFGNTPTGVKDPERVIRIEVDWGKYPQVQVQAQVQGKDDDYEPVKEPLLITRKKHKRRVLADVQKVHATHIYQKAGKR